MSPNVNTEAIETVLIAMFSPGWLRETASKVGFIKRNRKIDAAAFFWVLILGFGVGVERSLASLRRAYETKSGTSIVPSAFYDRFSSELVAFLKECLIHGIAELANNASLTLSAKLQGFKDLVVADGTLLTLHKSLARLFPGTRSEAQLKIHSVISVTTGGPRNVTFHSGKTAEVKTMRIGPWVKNTILLFDLGFFKYQLFSRIMRNGGYFVSRLKQTANPVIVSVLRQCRGRAIDLAGKNLQDILPHLKREVFDVLVEVSFKRRSYRGKASAATEIYRLAGILNHETQEYHIYITNLPPERLTAEDVALLYGARWSIELIFKEMKRIYQLDVLHCGNNNVVQALVLATILTLVVSRRLLNFIRQQASGNGYRYPSLRWAEIFRATSGQLLQSVLETAGIRRDPLPLLHFFVLEAADPNVSRKRLLDPWIELPHFPGG